MAFMKMVCFNTIAAALEEYQPGFSQQVYDDLAWSGLKDAPIFDTLFPIGSLDRIRISNRYDCEGAGHSIGQGTPNEQTPVGQPCN
jgi:hypothetical protein